MTEEPTTCHLCGMDVADAATCERGDCPIERKPEKSIYPYPRFEKVDDDINESTHKPAGE